MKIEILINNHIFLAELNSSTTAKAISNALPVEGSCALWGDEIYFGVPVQVDLEDDSKEIVEPGDLAFWPGGNVFCIFFGPTPVSTENKPRAISPVNVFGRIKGDLSRLKTVAQGDLIRVKSYQK